MSANELWELLREESQSVGLATVYRALRRGVEEGRLVAVGPAVETGVAFPLLARRHRPLAPAAQTLRAWLLAHAPD